MLKAQSINCTFLKIKNKPMKKFEWIVTEVNDRRNNTENENSTVQYRCFWAEFNGYIFEPYVFII